MSLNEVPDLTSRPNPAVVIMALFLLSQLASGCVEGEAGLPVSEHQQIVSDDVDRALAWLAVADFATPDEGGKADSLAGQQASCTISEVASAECVSNQTEEPEGKSDQADMIYVTRVLIGRTDNGNPFFTVYTRRGAFTLRSQAIMAPGVCTAEHTIHRTGEFIEGPNDYLWDSGYFAVDSRTCDDWLNTLFSSAATNAVATNSPAPTP